MVIKESDECKGSVLQYKLHFAIFYPFDVKNFATLTDSSRGWICERVYILYLYIQRMCVCVYLFILVGN